MKAQQLTREARLRRALERWENEGGRIALKGGQLPARTQSEEMGTMHTKRAYESPHPKPGTRSRRKPFGAGA